MHFANLTTANFETLRSSYGDPRFGPDGFWRENDPEWRKEMDALEGKSLRALLGSALSESMEKDLQGKVVLVDFWGTWCGPCLGLMTDLKRFHETYGNDQFEARQERPVRRTITGEMAAAIGVAFPIHSSIVFPFD